MIYETYLVDVQILMEQREQVAKIARTAEQYHDMCKARNREKNLNRKIRKLKYAFRSEINERFIKNDGVLQGKQMTVTNQAGETQIVDLSKIEFSFHAVDENNKRKLDGKYALSAAVDGYYRGPAFVYEILNFDLCVRDTPEQIIDEVERLKDAVRRGDTKITFFA